METPTLDHPTLARVKAAFPGVRLQATEFRQQTTLIAPAENLHAVMRYLRDDPECDYDFLSDVVGVDYLGYPARTQGRFAVVYLLASYARGRRFAVKVLLDPSRAPTGIAPDPQVFSSR